MILFHLLENKLKIGGMIRCIRNDYDLDKVENEINRTDSIADFEEMYESIK